MKTLDELKAELTAEYETNKQMFPDPIYWIIRAANAVAEAVANSVINEIGTQIPDTGAKLVIVPMDTLGAWAYTSIESATPPTNKE